MVEKRVADVNDGEEQELQPPDSKKRPPRRAKREDKGHQPQQGANKKRPPSETGRGILSESQSELSLPLLGYTREEKGSPRCACEPSETRAPVAVAPPETCAVHGSDSVCNILARIQYIYYLRESNKKEAFEAWLGTPFLCVRRHSHRPTILPTRPTSPSR
jgi:hypothetical protein